MSSQNFTFAIDDVSPVISYFGGTSGSAWTLWFSQSGATPNPVGETPVGQSFHNSSTVGSGFTLSFQGVWAAQDASVILITLINRSL